MPAQKQIQARRGTAASWTSTNPTLADGEIGFETDTFNYKIGNGTLPWAALNYVNSNVVNDFSFISGTRYGTATSVSSSANYGNTQNNNVFFASVYVPKKTTFTQVRITRSTANTTTFTIQMGLYSSVNDLPNTLLYDFGARTSTSSALFPTYVYTALTNVPFTLNPGVYWFAVRLISNTTTSGYVSGYGPANMPQSRITNFYGVVSTYADSGLPTNPTLFTYRNVGPIMFFDT